MQWSRTHSSIQKATIICVLLRIISWRKMTLFPFWPNTCWTDYSTDFSNISESGLLTYYDALVLRICRKQIAGKDCVHHLSILSIKIWIGYFVLQTNMELEKNGIMFLRLYQLRWSVILVHVGTVASRYKQPSSLWGCSWQTSTLWSGNNLCNPRLQLYRLEYEFACV